MPKRASTSDDLTTLLRTVLDRGEREAFLEQHRAWIRQARADGESFRTIAEGLRARGGNLSPETLRRYFVQTDDAPKPTRRLMPKRRRIL